MTTSVFAVKPEGLTSDRVETRHFAPNEIADDEIIGTLLIRFRGGDNVESAYFDVSMSQWDALRGEIADFGMTRAIGVLHLNGIVIVNLPDVMSVDFRARDDWGRDLAEAAEHRP